MGRRFPVCTAKDVLRVLRKNGFVLVGQKGSHKKLRHQNGAQVIVPDHGNKPLPIGTLKSIIDGGRIDREDFRISGKERKGRVSRWRIWPIRIGGVCQEIGVGVGIGIGIERDPRIVAMLKSRSDRGFAVREEAGGVSSAQRRFRFRPRCRGNQKTGLQPIGQCTECGMRKSSRPMKPTGTPAALIALTACSVLGAALPAAQPGGSTEVSMVDGRWHIGGEVLHPGAPAEGLLIYVVPSLDLVVWKLGGRDSQY